MNCRAARRTRIDRVRVGVDVVEQQDVEPAVGRPQVVLHVGLDGAGLEQRALGPLDRDVHQRECRHLLRLAVLEDREVPLPQVADELPLGVDHDGVDFDVVHLRAEGDRRHLRVGLRRRLRGRTAGRLRRRRGRLRGDGERRHDEQHGHGTRTGMFWTRSCSFERARRHRRPVRPSRRQAQRWQRERSCHYRTDAARSFAVEVRRRQTPGTLGVGTAGGSNSPRRRRQSRRAPRAGAYTDEMARWPGR